MDTSSMNPLVKSLVSTPAGRVFFEDRVFSYTWEQAAWLSDYEVLICLDDGRKIQISDSDEKLGIVYLASDSGSELSNIMVPLKEGEPDPKGIPDEASTKKNVFTALQPIFESVNNDITDPDDLDFCRQIFNSPAAQLRAIQKEGSLLAARKAILRDIFQIT